MHFVFLVGGNKTTFTQKQGFFFSFFRFCDLPEVAIIQSKGLARFGYIPDMKAFF